MAIKIYINESLCFSAVINKVCN